MLNPNIGKLLDQYENRYELVVDVAKLARKISSKAEEEGVVLSDKPVTIAINELAQKKCNAEQ